MERCGQNKRMKREEDKTMKHIRQNRVRQIALWLCTYLSILIYPVIAAAEEATPLESIQIMSGNYRKGGGVGAIGHLGGVPVMIPKEFAYFVEYDGDPGFLEKRKGKKPERTFDSGIRSFGFEIRYPDMVPVNDKNWAEKRKENIYTSLWLNVTVLSNANYQDRNPHRMAMLASSWLSNARRFHEYKEQPKKVNDLTEYVPLGVDTSRRELNSKEFHDGSDRNIYIHYLGNRDVDTVIDCSNMNHAAAPCEHRFGLEPGMKASVNVSYRKGMLPYWREIQNGVTQVLLGFRVDSSKMPTVQPQSSQFPSSKTKD